MDLVIAVVCCNCTIAIVVLVITLWTIRWRRQLVGITECCDRWEGYCRLVLSNAPESISAGRCQIQSLHQLYQQQQLTLDRLRALGVVWGISRSLITRRRK